MKKFLKITIGLLLVLLAIFLAAGVVSPQVKYKTTVSIDKPLDEVWMKFNDSTLLPEWMPGVKEVKMIRNEPGIVGSEYSLKVESEGGDFVMNEKVEEFEPRNKVKLRLNAGDMMKTSTYIFSAGDASVVIAGDHICEGRTYLFKCLFAFFKPMFRRIDNEHMNQFKDWVERS